MLRYAVVTPPQTVGARRCDRASVAIFLNMLKKITVGKVGQWIANAPQCTRCGRCDVAVSSMRSLCHLHNRYAIVPHVTYSLIYRNPNDLWKVRLSPFPTSAILCCDRSDLWKVPRMLRSQHKIADVGNALNRSNRYKH